jgi:cytochrome c5
MYTRRPTVLLITATIWCAAASLRGTSLAAQQGAEAVSPVSEIPAGDGSDTLRASCLTCHGTALITQQRLSREAWSREVDKMIGWGAVVAADQRSGLLNYLASHFGDEPILSRDTPATDGAALLKTRCQVCHDLRLIEQQRLDRTGWTREVDKMIGWGAVLTDAERETLIAYLGRDGS